MTDSFQQARLDLCLGDEQNFCQLSLAPERWDEYLELDCPILVAWTCQTWSELGSSLWKSGLSSDKSLSLVESHGAVINLSIEDGLWSFSPQTSKWFLAIGWHHPKQGWRSRLPLAGKAYLVARQKEQGQDLVEKLQELGAKAWSTPAIEFQAADDPSILLQALCHLDSFDWLIFTSPNGVNNFFVQLLEAGLDHRALADLKFACIGPGTAKALRKQGFHCDLIPEKYVAEGLLAEIEAKLGEGLENLSFLIPRAQDARQILPETLRQWGARVVVAPAYRTVLPQPLTALEPEEQKGARLLLTSSSTASHWAKINGTADFPCFCIGPVTAAHAENLGFQVLGVAQEHSIDGLLKEILWQDGQNW